MRVGGGSRVGSRLPVDPTIGWFGVSAEYILWFVTDDGEMPFVYLDMPQIKRL